MKLTDEQRREIGGLTEHPGWATLERIVEADRESEVKKLALELLSSDLKLIREDVARKAGHYNGMKDVLDTVRAARKAVEAEALKERDGSERSVVR